MATKKTSLALYRCRLPTGQLFQIASDLCTSAAHVTVGCSHAATDRCRGGLNSGCTRLTGATRRAHRAQGGHARQRDERAIALRRVALYHTVQLGHRGHVVGFRGVGRALCSFLGGWCGLAAVRHRVPWRKKKISRSTEFYDERLPTSLEVSVHGSTDAVASGLFRLCGPKSSLTEILLPQDIAPCFVRATACQRRTTCFVSYRSPAAWPDALAP